MARTFEQYEDGIVKVIQKYKIKHIIHIFEHYNYISYPQFYAIGLNKSDRVLKALSKNRESKKADMMERWMQPDANPTLQLAAFKLMATPEERDALATTSKIDAKVDASAGLMVTFKNADSE